MQKIGEHNTVVTRIPIFKDGEVTGAVGKMVFRDVKDLRVLARKLTSLQSELEYYKEELQKVHGERGRRGTLMRGLQRIYRIDVDSPLRPDAAGSEA